VLAKLDVGRHQQIRPAQRAGLGLQLAHQAGAVRIRSARHKHPAHALLHPGLIALGRAIGQGQHQQTPQALTRRQGLQLLRHPGALPGLEAQRP